MGNNSTTITKVFVGENETKLIKEQYIDGNRNYRYMFDITETNKVNYNDKYWESIKEKGYQDIDFCILNNGMNGVSECMGLFPNTSNLDQFAVTKGPTKCKSYYNRPGLVYHDKNNFDLIERELGKPEEGTLCRLVFQDYNYDDNDLERCCFSDNKVKCNKNLNNGYNTSHCNIIMQKKCVNNEDDPKCMLWLEKNYDRKENTALEFYSNYCSDNFSSPVCNYLCRVSRENNDYRSSFCDKALTNYCEKNRFDSRCFCVITPTNMIPDIESYLGPKECWFSSCSSQSESKWLTTAQIDTRQKCNLTSCVISIDQLILKNDSKVDLINDCISGSTVNSSYNIEKRNKGIEIHKTPGVLFYPSIGILSLSLILLLKI